MSDGELSQLLTIFKSLLPVASEASPILVLKFPETPQYF